MNRNSCTIQRYGARWTCSALLALAIGAATALTAQTDPPRRDTAAVLDTLRVTGRYDNLIGIAATASQGRVGAMDLRSRPITREGELLETVPGKLGRGLRLEAALLNVLNSRAADIQYYYPSRLRGEPAEGVNDVHFHPAEPRQLRASLTWSL